MKRNIYKIISLFTVCVFCNLGCSKTEEVCESVSFTPINWQYMTNYKIVDDKLEDKYLVINSQQELDAQVIPDPLYSYIGFKDIDFTTSTLLVGKKALGHGAGQLLSQRVNHICKSDKDIYKVVIKNGGYTALTKFNFGVVVPKKDAALVVFDVSVVE